MPIFQHFESTNCHQNGFLLVQSGSHAAREDWDGDAVAAGSLLWATSALLPLPAGVAIPLPEGMLVRLFSSSLLAVQSYV